MNQLLGVLVDVYVLVYLDNTVIFSYIENKYWNNIYIWHLTGLLSLSIILSTKKCKLFSKKVEFLSNTVSATGVGFI